MSDIKNRLVRLGSQHPDLQDDIEPVLRHLDKESRPKRALDSMKDREPLRVLSDNLGVDIGLTHTEFLEPEDRDRGTYRIAMRSDRASDVLVAYEDSEPSDLEYYQMGVRAFGVYHGSASKPRDWFWEES